MIPYSLWTNHFFHEQISHLEIAVREYVHPYRSKPPKLTMPFEGSNTEKVLKALQSIDGWTRGSEIAELAGVKKKSLCNHFTRLKEMGYKILCRGAGNQFEYRLEPTIS